MYQFIYNTIIKWNEYLSVSMRRTLNTLPLFEILLGISLILMRLIFNEISENEYLFRYEAPFYDTGSMMSFLMCLEHIYVCYYLIIIIIMVYWFLYICITDFSGWTLKNKNFVLNNFIINQFNLLIYKIFLFFYYWIIIIKENNYIYNQINYNSPKQIKEYLKNNIKLNNVSKNELNLNNLNNTFDLLGRSYLVFNIEKIKYWKFINIISDFNLLITYKNIINELQINKYINKYLFYSKPKLFDFFYYLNIILYLNNKKNQTILVLNKINIYLYIYLFVIHLLYFYKLLIN